MGSKPRSSQWQRPTLVLAKSTSFTFGVCGVRMRGRELSTGKKRPASPPCAPPGHWAQPALYDSIPVVVTAMWKSALASAMRSQSTPRLFARAACSSSIEPLLSMTMSRSTLGVDWSHWSVTVWSACEPAVRPIW